MKLIEAINNIRLKIIIYKYSKLYFESIKDNKEKLIEAFVSYYGEEYRDLIINRFKNMRFYAFISAATRDKVIPAFIK